MRVPGKGKIQRLKILTAPGGRKGKIPQFAELWNRPQNAIIFPWILDVLKWQGSSCKYLKIF